MLHHFAAALSLALAFTGAHAGPGTVLGEVRSQRIAEGDSLIELARTFDLGFAELASANPALDPFVPTPGATALIPTSWIVPALSRDEVLVNLSERRLYLLHGVGEGSSVVTFPIGIGVEGRETPAGTYRVVSKEVHPAWRVPASVRREEPDLPAVVPPGPDNPLGTHALRLSAHGILIHGTNKPFGVGRQVSHGCIRLYPEDIPVLFGLVPVGARVRVVRQPVKVGVDGSRVVVEIHDDPEAGLDLLDAARWLLERRNLLDHVDPERLAAAVDERSGVPVEVGRL